MTMQSDQPEPRQVTGELAKFASRLGFPDLAPHLVERLKIYVLDAVGCGLYGTSLPWARIVREWVSEQGGKAEAALWESPFRGPCANIALALGVMIHGMDFDDYHNAKIHPGAPVIPAALTVGELLEASGRDVLTAIAAGYETMIRISLATGPNASRMKGWHLTGTTGTFGAAAAAGRLLGLSDTAMAGALGMAGTQSSGLWAFLSDGAMSKRFHAGRAGQSGVISAFLVRKGFRGPTRILEAEDGGFCRAMSDQVDFSRVTDQLGEVFHCADVNIKPYACCASSHSAVDAILDIRQKESVTAEEVESVVVKTARGVQVQCGFPYTAAGVVQAQMSLQYILAVALADGAALLDQFTESRITDSRLLDLARRVTIEVDPEIDGLYPRVFANRVEVILKNGRRLETRVDHPKGSSAHPMSYGDVANKFRGLTSRTISPKRVEEIIDRIYRLEQEPDIRNLGTLLSGS